MELDRETWDAIARHAQADYPAECCGILACGAGGGYRIHPCRNIQDRLHQKDPDAHPRSSRTAYRMDDLQVHGILTDTEESGGRLAGFYHSHIDCDAYFSEEDRTAALFMDEPTYPGVVHIVVSVVDGEVRGWRGFLWDDGERDFAEISIVNGG